MTERKHSPFVSFIAAVVVATVWGAIVQTQYNLAGVDSVGAAVPAGLRIRATLSDIFSGFSPTYAAYVVAPALLVAFAVASWVAASRPASRQLWFCIGGGLAILLAIPIVNFLAPVALLIGATRDFSCTVVMALGGAGAGFVYAWMTAARRSLSHERRGAEASMAH